MPLATPKFETPLEFKESEIFFTMIFIMGNQILRKESKERKV